jgi:hypothetical protein
MYKKLFKTFVVSATLLLLAEFCWADTAVGEEAIGSIALGKRSIALPPGKWTVIAESVADARLDGVSRGGGGIKSQYLLQTDAQKNFVAGINVRTTLSSVAASSWTDTTCDKKDTLHRDTLDGNFKFPACFLINHFVGFWQGGAPENKYNLAIWNWFKTNEIKLPKTAIFAANSKHFAGDFMVMTVWLNPDIAGIKPDDKTVWNESGWHPGLINTSPEKIAYIQEVKKWGESLIQNTRSSVLDGSPKQASLPKLPGLN